MGASSAAAVLPSSSSSSSATSLKSSSSRSFLRRSSAAVVWVLAAAAGVATAAPTTTDGPPPFFLQDATDSLCLAGETFQRCAVGTLWYVVGQAGTYQIHKRPVPGSVADHDTDDDGLCLVQPSCDNTTANADDSSSTPPPLALNNLRVAKCSHCGAKDWNILGDAETGYVLTSSLGSDSSSSSSSASGLVGTCLVRQDLTARMAPCDSLTNAYTPLQLRFATPSDINAMSSPAALLVGAAADGDERTIEAVLANGTDVNARDWDELTALIPAASAGHSHVCQLLLQKGINVNAADKDGITALMEASISGHLAVVELLLTHGADVEAVAASDVTAVWLAASEGHDEIVQALVEQGGASATPTRTDGISALMTAAVGGHGGVIRLLMAHGADVTTTDRDGVTPLMNAAENGTLAILEILLGAAAATTSGETDETVDFKPNAAYVNAVSKTGLTALIIASAHGHTEAVERLIAAGANVEITADSGVTPLMFAAAANHVAVMRVLMDHGATLEVMHSNGGTALIEAATGGALDAMRLLVEQGADVTLTDEDGVTPLMAVSSVGNDDAFAVVIEALQAKLDGEDLTNHLNLFAFSGGSSVMFSAAGGHLAITKRLVELGADAQAVARATPAYLAKIAKAVEEGTYKEEEPNVDGVTALHVAAQGGHLPVVQYLIDTVQVNVSVEDDDKRTALIMAIKGSHGEVANALVRAGANPNTPYLDDKGEAHNLLFDAIMLENEEFATLLIESGADLYHKDEKHVSTLLQASHRGLSTVAQLLLAKHGSSSSSTSFIDEASEDGVSPLMAAASEGHVEVVKHLIAAQANVNTKDKDDTTALMAAAARGHTSVVQELLHAQALVNEQNTDGHTALMFAYNGKNQVDTLWNRYSQFVINEEEGAAKDDNGTGPIIRELLDKHIALVELLHKAGANAALKDKEGHTAKDFDYHPDADSNVLVKEAKAQKVRDESKNEL